MRLTAITVWAVDLPLTKPYWLSGGRLRFDRLDATIVRLETDSGIAGWGEGTPWGHTYVAASGPSLRGALEILAPAILGLDPRQPLVLEQAMDTALPGHLFAKAPLAMAAADIAARAADLPLAEWLGGAFERQTRVMSSVSSGTPDEMIAEVERFRAMGYVGHSVKVGGDVETDIARIRAIEAARLPGERILYDVNRAWSRAEALAVMTAVADLAIAIEQPCESLDDIAGIRPLTRLAISVDERLDTLADIARIARDGLAEIVNVKLNRVGGPVRARRLLDMAAAHGLQSYVMATGGSVLADAEAAHVAATIPGPLRLGAWACQDMLSVDIAPQSAGRCTNGMIAAPEGPGLGVVPDEARLGTAVARYTS